MFAIGEFARLGRVSVRMLRHYDALGPLSPAHVDPATGYRPDEVRQLSRLNRIRALNGLGFTLHQVGSVLDDSVNAEQLRGMLRLRRAEIDTPGGLPVGVQIMGPLFEDDTPITFAHALADVVGGYEPPPEPAGDVPQPAGASTGHPSWR